MTVSNLPAVPVASSITRQNLKKGPKNSSQLPSPASHAQLTPSGSRYGVALSRLSNNASDYTQRPSIENAAPSNCPDPVPR